MVLLALVLLHYSNMIIYVSSITSTFAGSFINSTIYGFVWNHKSHAHDFI